MKTDGPESADNARNINFTAYWVARYRRAISCPGDIDCDRNVTFEDLLRVLDAWGNKGGPEDIDGSGTVDFGDLLIVLDAWGPCE